MFNIVRQLSEMCDTAHNAHHCLVCHQHNMQCLWDLSLSQVDLADPSSLKDFNDSNGAGAIKPLPGCLK